MVLNENNIRNKRQAQFFGGQAPAYYNICGAKQMDMPGMQRNSHMHIPIWFK